MDAERTFWEKATPAHVFCLQNRLRGARFARHWPDLARLDDAGFAEKAIADRNLANDVAAHKAMFFRETAGGAAIDYTAAVNGRLQLVPQGEAHGSLREDYLNMVGDGLLPDGAESFEDLMVRCAAIADRANTDR
jgi:hypothetical protein